MLLRGFHLSSFAYSYVRPRHMSFSSRRRNYLLTPHRRDGLIEWMKSMLQHSFVLDALETTASDTFSHFEMLIDEHRELEMKGSPQPSRLRQLVPTIGVFHTPLPLRSAFHVYNEKHQLTKRKHIQISFNEIRHILNLAQIMALRKDMEGEMCVNAAGVAAAGKDPLTTVVESLASSPVQQGQGGLLLQRQSEEDLSPELDDAPPGQLNGPKLISFDGDQTLYSDGANFESNPRLANYLYKLLRHGVCVAVVTAAGYEYNVEKYEYRLSGLLTYFKNFGLTEEECERFYLFGGECNYLLQLASDYRLHPVKERGPGGWCTSTSYLHESPANWPEDAIDRLLDAAENSVNNTLKELKLRGRVIRKRRSVGLVPNPGQEITRESLDETVLRVHEELRRLDNGAGAGLPYCAFNGGSDAWVDVGNKRVGVQILQSYLGISPEESLHIGDQFLNTGNDYAARDVSPCIWIINPQETTYILKSILRLAGVPVTLEGKYDSDSSHDGAKSEKSPSTIDFQEMERRAEAAKRMDVYTGEMVKA